MLNYLGVNYCRKVKRMAENNVFTAVNMMISTNRMHKKLIESGVSKQFGLHRTQHIILMILASKGKLPSQKELASRLNITPAAVTGAVKKLENSGYIRRSMGCDNRFNEIMITDKGRATVEKSKEIFSEIDNLLFSGFSNEELSLFICSLEKIQNNIYDRYKEVQQSEKMV